MQSFQQISAILIASVPLFMPAGYSYAQADADSGAAPAASTPDGEIPPLTQTEVEAALNELDANAALEEAVKQGIRSKFQQASKLLEEASALRETAKQYADALESAPRTAAETRQQLEAVPPAGQVDARSFSGTTEALQQQLATLQAEKNSLSEELSRITAQLADVKNRPAEISARLPAAQSELEAIGRRWNDFGDPAAITSPSRVADLYTVQAEHAKLLAEVEMLKQEQLSQAAREKLLAAEQQLLERRVARQKADADALRALLDQRLSTESERINARVSEAVAKIGPDDEEAQRLGETVQALAAEYETVVGHAKSVRAVHADLVSARKALLDQYALLREQVDLGGGGTGMAQSLIDLQRRLMNAYRDLADSNLPDLDQTRLALLRVESRLREQEALQAQVPDDASEAVPALIGLRREILEVLENQYAVLVRELAELQSDKQVFINEVKSVVADIDEQQFWIRTSPPMSWETFAAIPAGMRWVVRPKHGREVWQAILQAFTLQPLLSAVWVLGALALLLARPPITGALKKASERVKRISTDAYRHTLQALLFSILLALPVPLLLWFAAYALRQSPHGNEWVWDLAIGLHRAGWITFGAWLLAAVCHRAGLAVHHFGWKSFPVRRLRTSMLLFVGGSVPLILLLASTFHADGSYYFDSVGRVALIVWQLWTVFLLWRLFYRSGGILEVLRREQPEALMTRWRHVFSQFILAALLALVALAAVGYVIASMRLAMGLLLTVGGGSGKQRPRRRTPGTTPPGNWLASIRKRKRSAASTKSPTNRSICWG